MMAAFQFLRGLPFIASTFIFLNFLYELSRYTTNNSSWFYIFCYNSSSCNNGSFAYCHSLQDCNICSNPNLVFNANRLEGHAATLLRIWIVIDSTECCIVSYKAIISDEDASLILELTTAIDEYSLADMGIFATIGVERREHAERLWHFNVPKFGEQLPEFLWCVVLVVYLHSDANSLLRHLVHEEVGFAAVPDRIPCCYVISVFLYCHISIQKQLWRMFRAHISVRCNICYHPHKQGE